MKPEPDVTVTVTLLPTEQGGRAGPTQADRFGCVITTEAGNFDLRFRLTAALRPGDTEILPADFLDPENALRTLTAGSMFGLWEGRKIGTGRIEQVHRARAFT